MQRLWSDTRISLLSKDSEFEARLRKALPPTYEMEVIPPARLLNQAVQSWKTSMILWDLGSYSSSELHEFILANPDFSQNCSLLLLADSGDDIELEEWLQRGGIDFLLRNMTHEELRLRVKLATRPWVKAMATSFDFLAALNLDLTMTEQKVFLCFLGSPDLCAGRKDVMEKVWPEMKVHPNTLDVHLFNIRRKLESSGIRITFVNSKARWMLARTEKRAAPTRETANPTEQPAPLLEGLRRTES